MCKLNAWCHWGVMFFLWTQTHLFIILRWGVGGVSKKKEKNALPQELRKGIRAKFLSKDILILSHINHVPIYFLHQKISVPSHEYDSYPFV